MGNCVICGKETGPFAPKTKAGPVCKECVAFVPYKTNVSSTSVDSLKKMVDANRDKAKQFQCTASYGNLYIDTLHNLFLISRKSDKGSPLEYGQIWHISDCEEVGIFCTDIKNIGKSSNYIVCTIKLRVKERHKNSEDFIVLIGEKCSFKPSAVDHTLLECREPEKLSVFRNMFNQMVDNALFAMARKLDYLNELKIAIETAAKDVAQLTDGDVTA